MPSEYVFSTFVTFTPMTIRHHVVVYSALGVSSSSSNIE